MGGGSWRLSCSAVISCTNQRPISKTRKHTHRRQARTKARTQARTKGAQKHDRRHRKQKSTRSREHESTRAKKHERAEGERDTLRSNHGRAAALPRIKHGPRKSTHREKRRRAEPSPSCFELLPCKTSHAFRFSDRSDQVPLHSACKTA